WYAAIVVKQADHEITKLEKAKGQVSNFRVSGFRVALIVRGPSSSGMAGGFGFLARGRRVGNCRGCGQVGWGAGHFYLYCRYGFGRRIWRQGSAVLPEEEFLTTDDTDDTDKHSICVVGVIRGSLLLSGTSSEGISLRSHEGHGGEKHRPVGDVPRAGLDP